MASSLNWIYEHEENIVAVIPEAWEMIPEGHGSPVKTAAIRLIRKGLTLGNVMWFDGQDLRGMDKQVLRSVGVWLFGVQSEKNEIENVMAHVPDSLGRKVQPADIRSLTLGSPLCAMKTPCAGHTCNRSGCRLRMPRRSPRARKTSAAPAPSCGEKDPRRGWRSSRCGVQA